MVSESEPEPDESTAHTDSPVTAPRTNDDSAEYRPLDSRFAKSQSLFERAVKVLPGGVSRNTIFRKPHPFYVDRGVGSRVYDVDGICRVDFANNMCALIHGHAHPAIIQAVSEQLAKGTAFTLATESELRFAELLCKRVPYFDKIRFMNSGTEAVMVAIKAARCFTGRPKIAKAEGAYHGTYDYAEVSQKSRPENWGDANNPSSMPVAKGTPQGALGDVVVVPFNNIEQTISLLNQNANDISCVILDPLPHRIGLIPASNAYVSAIREWTFRNNALMIFDEVITFRMKYGGALEWFDDTPDLTALGKIIGGGFPVGAVAGREEVMAVLDPARPEIPFPHSGTFSANPITMTAGRVAMELFDRKQIEQINRLGDFTRAKLAQAIQSTGIQACVTGAGSMFRIHLKSEIPANYRETYMDQQNIANIKLLVDHMFENGFMLISTCTGALSTVMTESDICDMVDSMKSGFSKLVG